MARTVVLHQHCVVRVRMDRLHGGCVRACTSVKLLSWWCVAVVHVRARVHETGCAVDNNFFCIFGSHLRFSMCCICGGLQLLCVCAAVVVVITAVVVAAGNRHVCGFAIREGASRAAHRVAGDVSRWRQRDVRPRISSAAALLPAVRRLLSRGTSCVIITTPSPMRVRVLIAHACVAVVALTPWRSFLGCGHAAATCPSFLLRRRGASCTSWTPKRRRARRRKRGGGGLRKVFSRAC